jgi:hypothetical protein
MADLRCCSQLANAATASIIHPHPHSIPSSPHVFVAMIHVLRHHTLAPSFKVTTNPSQVSFCGRAISGLLLCYLPVLVIERSGWEYALA